MRRSFLCFALVGGAIFTVAGCEGDRCLPDDVDCIVDHMVLVQPVNNGARIELVKRDSSAIEPLIPPPPCAATRCGASCVSLDVDRHNCGACGKACGFDQQCVKGACACPAGTSICGASCVDLMSSGTDCGACFHVCSGSIGSGSSSSSASSSSSSSAQSSSSSSSGSSSSTGSSSSSSSSGGGGAGGGGAGFFCSAGVCTTDCPAPRKGCGQSCVDTDTDPNHCGGCNIACKTGETCVNGACTCTSPPYACGCIDPGTDPQNCGGCGVTCGPAQTCETGVCWPPPPDAKSPLAIANSPTPLVFIEPSGLQPLEIDWRDPNGCQPALCSQVCNDDKCSSHFACTRPAQDKAEGIFRPFIGFLATPRSSSALFTITMVPFSAAGCPADLVDRLGTGVEVTVGAGARIPAKMTSDASSATGDACTKATDLCGCALKACSDADGSCSYEVNGKRINCGEHCDCASAVAAASKMCCP